MSLSQLGGFKMENLGNKFTVVKKDGTCVVLRNVTEVHFNYTDGWNWHSNRVSFESDIHSTGITYPINDIVEFYSEIESEKSDNF